MLQRNLDTPILDMLDKPIKAGEDDMTLKTVALQAILGQLPSDQSMDQAKRLKLWVLAQKVNKGFVQEFSPEDLTLIKERINGTWPTLVYGRAVEILDADFKGVA